MTALSNRSNLLNDRAPGVFHMGISFPHRGPDRSRRGHLFVAMEQATRWVFMHWHRDRPADCIADFLLRLDKTSPVRVQRIIADSHRGVDHRSTGVYGTQSDGQVFGSACLRMGIELQSAAPLNPTDRGMVERFTGSFYRQRREDQSARNVD